MGEYMPEIRYEWRLIWTSDENGNDLSGYTMADNHGTKNICSGTIKILGKPKN